MARILVSLVGDQPSPTLILAKYLGNEIDRIVLMSGIRMVEKKVIQHVTEALKTLGVPEVTFVKVEPFSLDSCQGDLETALGREADQPGRFVVDVTGGTKIMSIGLFIAATRLGLPVVYVDTTTRVIRELGPIPSGIDHERGFPPLPIRTIMTAYGHPVVRASDWVAPNREDLAKLFVREPSLWKAWHECAGALQEGDDIIRINNLPKSSPVHTLLPKLVELRFVEDLKRRYDNGYSFRVPDKATRQYLASGTWLEDYIFLEAKKCGFDEVLARVGVGNISEVSGNWGNEVDVIISHRSTLSLVSCKAGRVRNIEKEHLAETFTLAQLAGGVFSRRIIVTDESVSRSLRERARAFKIDLIEESQLPSVADHLRELIDPDEAKTDEGGKAVNAGG